MRTFLALVALMAVAVLALWRGWLEVPPRWNPWAPLNVQDAPNLFTRWKLARLAEDPALCQQVLAQAGVRFTLLAPGGGRCPLHNTVRVQQAGVQLSSSFIASCPLAAAFALFERHGLQPAARAVYGQPVVQVEHLGSFACRNVYHRAQGRLSQHATANALDIAAFRLADGRRVSVLEGWQRPDSGAFLRQARDSACTVFTGVLGPDYNLAHHNHFHFDMGRWSVCR